MHDPLAVAAAIDPSLCAWIDTRSRSSSAGTWTRGETVTDLLNIRNTVVGGRRRKRARRGIGGRASASSRT
jgi:inosine-uridine nucleoside N-ribohydrolase